MQKKEILVISLGGSIIIPDKLDIKFLKEFREIILKYTDRYQFIISTGGGKIAREYASAAKEILKDAKQENLDWIGIECTRLNAQLIKTIFGEHAYPTIIIEAKKQIKTAKPVILAAGDRPGSSSDYDAVKLAKLFKTKKILNLTNIDYIYNKDPATNTFAKPLKNLTWEEYRKIIPEKFEYGMHVPFDPVASKEAEKNKTEVILINGHKLMQIKNFLDQKEFIGSVIK